MGVKLESLALRRKERDSVFENSVLRRILRSKREDEENCIMRSFIICTPAEFLDRPSDC
jgi:hypothetical protein